MPTMCQGQLNDAALHSPGQALSRGRSSKDGQLEHKFIHNKCHHVCKVMLTLVGFTNSEVRRSWLKRPHQLGFGVCSL